MKKLLFIFIMFTSFTIYGLQKSGIKEYDELDLTKGEGIKYRNKDPNLSDYYMKEYDSNITVLFYDQTDIPKAFFKKYDSENSKKVVYSKALFYKENGDLDRILEYKNDKMNGMAFIYDNGVLSETAEYKDDVLNGKRQFFINGKITNLIEYKNNKKIGKTIYYDENGAVSVIENYEDDKFISNENVNYRLQKTGIPEYDNIDFSKGEIIAYYNEKGEFVSKDSDEAIQYRKSFGKRGDFFLVVDYYVNTNNIQGIVETRKIYFFDILREAKMSFAFYENGNICYDQTLKEDGVTSEVKKYDYFGNLESIITYKKRKLINVKYVEQR